MRKFVQSVRHFRSAFQHRRANIYRGLVKRPIFLVDTNHKPLYKQSYNADINFWGHPSFMISRAVFTAVTKVTTGGMLLQ